MARAMLLSSLLRQTFEHVPAPGGFQFRCRTSSHRESAAAVEIPLPSLFRASPRDLGTSLGRRGHAYSPLSVSALLTGLIISHARISQTHFLFFSHVEGGWAGDGLTRRSLVTPPRPHARAVGAGGWTDAAGLVAVFWGTL